MTVTYTPAVANSSSYCIFWKALKIYRGSVYKIVWRDLVFFVIVFLTIQFTSINFLSESQQLAFKQMRDSFYIIKKRIPMQYVLGFFVILIVDRWKFIQESIPSADTFSLLVNTAMSSDSERSRLMRRTTVRYAIASSIINIRTISLKMMNKFPTFQSITNLGILLKNEEEILDKIEEHTLMTTYTVPLVWATNIINRARKEGLINNDCIVQDLLTELGSYGAKLGDLLSYDLVSIPLFYIQVVTLAMYSYFIATIIGHQVCREDGVSNTELIVSLLYASLDFTFHVGWLKVAEVLINPFGEDDEDFEVDLMVDRNLKAAYMIVDYMRVKEPDYHHYDYPVLGNTSNMLYQNVDECNNFKENIYSCIEEEVETQTEDEHFLTYENVSVPSGPLQLLTPSHSSLHVDYINTIYDSIPIKNVSSSQAGNMEESSIIYENVSVPSATPRLKTPQRSSYVDYINDIYNSTPTDEVSSSEARNMKESIIYENIPLTSAPQQLQTPPQSLSHIDNVNIICQNVPTNEAISSEPKVGNLKEVIVCDSVPMVTTPLQQRSPSTKPQYVDHVNVIIKNVSTDGGSSSDSDSRSKHENTNFYESAPVASASLKQQTSPQSLLSPLLERFSVHETSFFESEAKPVEETKAFENVNPKPKKGNKRFSFANFKFSRKN